MRRRPGRGSPATFTARRDVLDTWFSSALVAVLDARLAGGDAGARSAIYPTAVLVTGFDIIFFWVARMMMMGLHFMHEIPFRDVYIHALVRDEKGAKMSKSKGNVIDPLELIDRYGADALRFTLAAMAAQGRDIKLSTARVEGYRNFATKLWNASRFAEMNGCGRVAGFDPAAVRGNRSTAGFSARPPRRSTRPRGAIEAFRFNDAANAAYRFVWNIFCDWHLELAKPVLQGGAEAAGAAPKRRRRSPTCSTRSYALLHPFMPFLTEELWAIKGEEGPKRAGPLALGPVAARRFRGRRGRRGGDRLAVDLDRRNPLGALRDGRAARRATAADAGRRRARRSSPMSSAWGETIQRLARVDADRLCASRARRVGCRCSCATTWPRCRWPGSSTSPPSARGSTRRSPRSGEIAKVDAKLANADFVARAPEEVVEEHQERRERVRAHRQADERARNAWSGSESIRPTARNVAFAQQWQPTQSEPGFGRFRAAIAP